MDELRILVIIMTAVLGLVVGSFLNVLIYRLPLNKSIAFPASHCPKCEHKLKWYDNIPTLSYLILGGKCRYCKEPINPRYLVVELTNAALWLISYKLFGFSPMFALSCVFLSVLIVIIFIDLEHFIIPDILVLVILGLGVISLFFPYEMSIGEKFLGLTVSLLLFLISYLLGRALKKEAIGGGDIKLVLAVGLFLGIKLTILGLFLAALLGTLIEVPRLLKVRKNNQEEYIVPFGPYLAFGFIISLFVGNQILSWYVNLLMNA